MQQGHRQRYSALGLIAVLPLLAFGQNCRLLPMRAQGTVTVPPIATSASLLNSSLYFVSTAIDTGASSLVSVDMVTGNTSYSQLSILDRNLGPMMMICDANCSALYLFVNKYTASPMSPCLAIVSTTAFGFVRFDARGMPSSPPKYDAFATYPATISDDFIWPGNRVGISPPGAPTYAFVIRRTSLYGYLDVVRLAPAGDAGAVSTVLGSRTMAMLTGARGVVTMAPYQLACVVAADLSSPTSPEFIVHAYDVAGLVANGTIGGVNSLANVRLDINADVWIGVDASANGTVAVALGYPSGATGIFIVRGVRTAANTATMTLVTSFILGETAILPRLSAAALVFAFSSEGTRLAFGSTLASCTANCAPYLVTAELATLSNGALNASQAIVNVYSDMLGGAFAQPLLGRVSSGSGATEGVTAIPYRPGMALPPRLDAFRLPATVAARGSRVANVTFSPPGTTYLKDVALQKAATPSYLYLAFDTGVLAQVSAGPRPAVLALASLFFNDFGSTSAFRVATAPGLAVAVMWRLPYEAYAQSFRDGDLAPLQVLPLANLTAQPLAPLFDDAASGFLWGDRYADSTAAICPLFWTYRLAVTGSGPTALQQLPTLQMSVQEMCAPSPGLEVLWTDVQMALSVDGSGNTVSLQTTGNGTFSVLAVQYVWGAAAGTAAATLPGRQHSLAVVHAVVGWPAGRAFFLAGVAAGAASTLLVRRIDTVTWTSAQLPFTGAMLSSGVYFDGGAVYASSAAGAGLLLSFYGGYWKYWVNLTAGTAPISSVSSCPYAAAGPIRGAVDPSSSTVYFGSGLTSLSYIAASSYSVPAVYLASATPSPSTSSSPSVSASLSSSISTSVTASISGSTTPSLSSSASGSTTPSISGSVSPSQSISASASPTPSVSPSISASPSVSATVSVTPSLTASRSTSGSPSASLSTTASRTGSPSATQSRTTSPSTSASESVTPSVSVSGSVSESASASPSVSPSTTATPSLSKSPTRSATESRSPSVSRTASASPSVSPSITESPSVSPSLTASTSPSPSLSRSPGSSASNTGTGTATSTYTPSAPATSPPSTVSPSMLPSATSSETGSNTGTGSSTATSSETASSTLTGTGTRTRTRSGTPTQTRSQTGTLSRSWSSSETASASSTAT